MELSKITQCGASARQNPSVSQPMVLGQPTLIGSNYNITRRTGVLIHAWKAGPTSPFNLAIIPAGLAALDVNIIAVDWSAGAAEEDYDELVSNVIPKCVESVARFITWLNLETGATLDTYHLIGFEVGAHMIGLIGRALNGEVDLISALSPPSEGFDETNMLQATDGVLVEAIHSDISGTGIEEAVADLDFYPNGGQDQPGCEDSVEECNRDRAYIYYEESLRYGGFTGTLCDTVDDAISGNCESEDTVLMGGVTNRTGSSGVYYLTTNAEAPFSTG